MTVRELMKRLEQFPPEAQVVCNGQDGGIRSLQPSDEFGWGKGIVEISAGGPAPDEDSSLPGDITYRHAVLFSGAPLDDPKHRVVARQLLSEWGEARGLTVAGYATQNRDYRIGYALEFSGEITPPTQRTRLQGAGRKFPDELLTGLEERVPWPLPEGWQAPLADEEEEVARRYSGAGG